MNSSHELRELLEAMRELRSSVGPRAALATLTRTHGSTFRRPGTRMLVYEDGAVVCELSGGCPQRDIVLQACQVIASGAPRLVQYNAASGLDVLMEMGCGGELEVLLEPLDRPGALDFVEPLIRQLDQRRDARLVTLFGRDGNAVQPMRAVLATEGSCFDGIDDDAVVAAISNVEHSLPGDAAAARVTTRLLQMSDGPVDVMIESIAAPHALVVIGASAAARALLPLSLALGWITTWIDRDAAILRRADLPAGAMTRCLTPTDLPAAMAWDRHTSVLVMTHNLEHDVAWLAALQSLPLAYLGTLGSRERIHRMHADHGLAIAHLHAPAGLDIGSETPEEIALAIAAEVMAVLNRRAGGPLRHNRGAIH